MSCSAASWRIFADGLISGLGGRKIASLRGAHQEGKVSPRAAPSKSSRGVIRCCRRPVLWRVWLLVWLCFEAFKIALGF